MLRQDTSFQIFQLYSQKLGMLDCANIYSSVSVVLLVNNKNNILLF